MVSGPLFDAAIRGNPALLEPDGERVVGSMLQSLVRQRAYTVLIPKELSEANEVLVRPLIRPAVNGDATVQHAYARMRLFGYQVLPEFIKSVVCQRLDSFALTFPFYESLPPELRRMVPKGQKLPITNDDNKGSVAVGLGLNCTYTFAGANDATRILKQQPRHRELLVSDVLLPSGRALQLDEVFCPASPGALGAHALKAWERILPFMMRALILGDLLDSFGLRISDSQFIKIVDADSEIWRWSPQLVDNLACLSEQIDNGIVSFEAIKPKLSKLLFAHDLEATLDSVATQNTASSEPLPTTRSWVESDYRSDFIAGTLQTLESRFPQRQDLHELSRNFFSLHRRGACSYAEVLLDLTKCEDPQALRQQYRERLRRPNETKAVEPQLPESAIERIPAPARHESRVGVSNIFDLESWQSKLGVTEQRCVKQRIDRLKKGHLGDSVALGDGLYELRIHFGGGLRIYVGFLSDSEIAVVHAGRKNSQQRDIETARKTWCAVCP